MLGIHPYITRSHLKVSIWKKEKPGAPQRGLSSGRMGRTLRIEPMGIEVELGSCSSAYLEEGERVRG